LRKDWTRLSHLIEGAYRDDDVGSAVDFN